MNDGTFTIIALYFSFLIASSLINWDIIFYRLLNK